MASDDLVMPVFAVVEGHHCLNDDGFIDVEGTIVVALYASKQTAEQHASRSPHYSVSKLPVRTSLRAY